MMLMMIIMMEMIMNHDEGKLNMNRDGQAKRKRLDCSKHNH